MTEVIWLLLLVPLAASLLWPLVLGAEEPRKAVVRRRRA
jgi:hypothetical protein